jgi:hypothetical protein
MQQEINTVLGFTSLKDVLEVVLTPITLALLAPWITRRFQERQRELEIKRELIAEISGLVMNTVMSIYLLKTKPAQKRTDYISHDDELDRIYNKWRVDNCVIGSKLHAYFPDPQKTSIPIHLQWRDFSERLSHYYEFWRDNSFRKDERAMFKDKEDLFKSKESVIREILQAKLRWSYQRRIKNKE